MNINKLSRRGFLTVSCLTAAGLVASRGRAVKVREDKPGKPVRFHKSQFVLGCNLDAPPLNFGARHLESAFAVWGISLKQQSLDTGAQANVLVFASAAEAAKFAEVTPKQSASVKPEGYQIFKAHWQGAPVICVAAPDESGAMYGLLDLAEQVRRTGSLAEAQEKFSNPRFPFRAIKFNLPIMAYRDGDATQVHAETCRDLKFWEAFLDMMAENRYNALTLWSLHPFAYMIRPKNFPEACALSDAELAQWQTLWHGLFRLAKERGIETYMVNWNIFVSPEFATAHGVALYSKSGSNFGEADTSELVKRYTRECVTQVIDEYPDLTGLGITLGEHMGGMTPQDREDWLMETFGEGMKAASRKIKFIHRAPLSANTGSGGSTDDSTAHITRQGIDSLSVLAPTWVEMKFNWSHAYSSPTLFKIHGGKVSDDYWKPPPTNYKVTWMIRNEDFFVLRWGDPAFARRLIARNSPDYVGGYFVGSECSIPAKNYLDKPDLPERAAYAFQRQWLLYMLWGRLMHDPATPDTVFEEAFDARYGKGVGKPMLAAYGLASRMPERLATFHNFTWDYSLYSEGFLAPSGGSGKDGFITIRDLINSQPVDLAYLSIPDYVKAVQAGQTFDASHITPPALAASLEQDGNAALGLVKTLPVSSAALEHEVADVRAWSYLSLYFAAKLRAGVALETFYQIGNAGRQKDAVAQLTQAAAHWDDCDHSHEAVP